jgi:hypothetical protein
VCRIAKHLLPREVVHGAQGASLEQKRVAQLGLIVQLCLQQATDSESGILHNRTVLHATGTRQSTSSNTPMHTDYARHGSSRCVKVTRPLEHRPFPPPKASLSVSNMHHSTLCESSPFSPFSDSTVIDKPFICFCVETRVTRMPTVHVGKFISPSLLLVVCTHMYLLLSRLSRWSTENLCLGTVLWPLLRHITNVATVSDFQSVPIKETR